MEPELTRGTPQPRRGIADKPDIHVLKCANLLSHYVKYAESSQYSSNTRTCGENEMRAKRGAAVRSGETLLGDYSNVLVSIEKIIEWYEHIKYLQIIYRMEILILCPYIRNYIYFAKFLLRL